jgi:2,3-bisphosphoglycerate-dependent phosphoglycerate mutase
MAHMMAALMGTERTWSLGVQNTAVFELTVDAERWWQNDNATYHNNLLWRVNRFNDSSHLQNGL